MALIKFGGGIVQASGSIAGTVHARNRFGNYTRPRTKPVNPRSSKQVVIREAIGLLTQKWHDVLSDAQRTAWNTYAAAVAMKNRLGEVIYITGFNHYCRVNVVRIQCGQSQCPNGPTVLSLPEKDPSFHITASAATQKITVTWDDTLPWGDIPASVMQVEMGVPQLKTRNFFNGPWKFVGSIPGNQTSPTEMTAPMTLIQNQKIWCYGRVSTGPTDSRLSEPFRDDCIVGA